MGGLLLFVFVAFVAALGRALARGVHSRARGWPAAND
jgi:hypothetical protein